MAINPSANSNDAIRSANVVRAFELKKKGWSFRAIGAELGVSHVTAMNYVNEAVAELVTPVASEYRKQLIAEIDDMIAKTWELLKNEQPMMQHGRVIKDDNGNPLIDKEFTLKVMNQLLRFLERRAKLTGSDMPTQSEHSVTVKDTFSDEYNALLASQEEANIKRLAERNKIESAQPAPTEEAA